MCIKRFSLDLRVVAQTLTPPGRCALYTRRVDLIPWMPLEAHQPHDPAVAGCPL
jgi:hypothetical protein